jgi:hypothetical protein
MIIQPSPIASSFFCPLRRRIHTLIPNSNNLIPTAAHLAARSNANLGCVCHGMNIWQNHCLHIDDSNSGFDHPLAGPRDGCRQLLVLGGEKPALQNSRKKIVIIKRHTKQPNDTGPPRGSTKLRPWLMESFATDLCKKAHRGNHLLSCADRHRMIPEAGPMHS